jgi:hypothetical protein
MIEDKFYTLFDFTKKISEDFQRQAKAIEKFGIRLVIYGINRTNSLFKFWGT